MAQHPIRSQLSAPEACADTMSALTRLAAVRSFDEFWTALDALLRPALGQHTLLGAYRHLSYVLTPEGRDEDPERVASLWLMQHARLRWEGKFGIVLQQPELVSLASVIDPPAAIVENGWTHALFDAFWDEGPLIASFALYRDGAFDDRAMQTWLKLRPFCLAVARQLAHLSTLTTQHEQTVALMDDLPIGLVLLNDNYTPVFVNREGYRQALLWNHAPAPPPPMTDARERFQMPEDLIDLCREMTRQWYMNLMSPDPTRDPDTRAERHYQVIRGDLKASINITPTAHDPLSAPSFLIRFHGMTLRTLRGFQPSPAQLALLTQLTPAERNTALLVAQGLSNHEIAERLNREVSTVKDHLSRVYGKLGLQSRTQLARLLTQ